ncbi:MAG: hypothetical protein AB7U79_07780 [Candidatus Izemoplasmatales bacterium]
MANKEKEGEELYMNDIFHDIYIKQFIEKDGYLFREIFRYKNANKDAL